MAKPISETNKCLTTFCTLYKGKVSQISGSKKVNTANSVKEKADCNM